MGFKFNRLQEEAAYALSKSNEKATIRLSKSGNIFDISSVIDGFYLNNGSLLASASYFTSEYIQVTPSKTYYINYERFINYFDENKTFISSVDSEMEEYIFTTPATCAYVRFTGRPANKLTTVLKEIPKNYGRNGIVFSTFGDSITQGNTFQPHVKRLCGFYAESNYGVAGTRVTGTGTTAMCNDARVNAIRTDTHVLLFMGGTNDWANNVVLGAETSTNVEEFYGALNVMAEKLTARIPSARIVFLTPPWSLMANRAGWTDTTGKVNNAGLTIGDYGTAIKNVARKYGFPCVDVYGEAGWNSGNIATYMTNDGNYIHPNNIGGERIAQLIVGKVKALSPVINLNV